MVGTSRAHLRAAMRKSTWDLSLTLSRLVFHTCPSPFGSHPIEVVAMPATASAVRPKSKFSRALILSRHDRDRFDNVNTAARESLQKGETAPLDPSTDHPLRVWMGFRARNSRSKSSSKTRPSISSGIGWPIRCRMVGAISISRAPSISIPFRKGLP